MPNSAENLKDMPFLIEQIYESLDNVDISLTNIKSTGLVDHSELLEKVSARVRQIAVDADDVGFSAIKGATEDILNVIDKIRNQEISPNNALYGALISLVTEIKAMIYDGFGRSLQENRVVPKKSATLFCNLAHHYHTDKAPGIAGHSYTPIYDQLFGSIRHNITKVLEIGIGPTIYRNPRRVIAGPPSNPFDPDLVQISGASLRTLAAYFPIAQVYGIDIVPSLLFEEQHIKTYLCDQSSKEQLRNFGIKHGPFDIIIDDGSHLPDHQVISFFSLFDFVRSEGYYLIEDVAAKDFFIDPFNHPSKIIQRLTDPSQRQETLRQVQYCANFSLNGLGYGYENSDDDHLIVLKKYA